MAIIRIHFIGIHNKPGCTPLDSKTRSGKLIDRIINHPDMQFFKCIKSNFYDLEYAPEDKRFIPRLWFDWWDRVNYMPKTDIVVPLGKLVGVLVSKATDHVSIAHPASIRSKERQERYVLDAVKRLRKASMLK